jgi:hypothetical protein
LGRSTVKSWGISIIWITTALADMIGRRLVRKRREERKETETVR